MKKYLAVILVFSMIFALAACGAKGGDAETTAAPEITEEAAVTDEAVQETAAVMLLPTMTAVQEEMVLSAAC